MLLFPRPPRQAATDTAGNSSRQPFYNILNIRVSGGSSREKDMFIMSIVVELRRNDCPSAEQMEFAGFASVFEKFHAFPRTAGEFGAVQVERSIRLASRWREFGRTKKQEQNK